jgi:hypothetical protein
MSKDTINLTTGETAQQTADRMAGNGKDGGVKGPTLTPAAKAPTNIHPSAPGGHSYGAPIEPTILH